MGKSKELQERLWKVTLGSSPLRVGWHIGETTDGKWLGLTGPTSPGTPYCENWETLPYAQGEQIGTSFYSIPYAPGNEWYLFACKGTVERVYEEAAAHENPEKPEDGCSGYGEEIPGWSKQEWQWNACYEGYYKGKEYSLQSTRVLFTNSFILLDPKTGLAKASKITSRRSGQKILVSKL